MAKVLLIEDFNGIAPIPADAVTIDDVSGYVRGYICLVRALHLKSSCTLIVRNQAVWHWLKQAGNKYGPEKICWESHSYRFALAKQWEMVIPEWVTNLDIQQAGLVEIQAVQPGGQSFEDTVLAASFSPLFQSSDFPKKHLGELLEVRLRQWADLTSKPLLMRIVQQKMETWKRKLSAKGEAAWVHIVEMLEEAPETLLNNLSNYRVLRGYPDEFGNRVLGEKWPVLRSASPDVSEIPVREAAMADAKAQLSIFYHSLEQVDDGPWNAAKALELLSRLSGVLVFEFERFQRILEKKELPLSKALVQQIRQRFQPIRARLSRELFLLDYQIEPIYPQAPESKWAADQWLEWAVGQYLPYRFWLEETDRLDPKMNEYEGMYEQWLMENYLEIRSNYPRIVYRLLFNVAANISKESVAVFIIIDNFNYKYAKVLQELLAEKSFFPNEMTQPYFSMLPSETAVSKKCLMSGEPEPVDIPTGGYDQLIGKAWKDHFSNIPMKYLASVSELSKLEKLSDSVYFLNYLPIDTTYHSDETETGMPHRDSIKAKLEALVAQINEFCHKHQAEEKLNVFICSDHGSTKISPEYPNAIHKQDYKGRVIAPGHRFVEINDKELEQLPPERLQECYVMKRKLYGFEKNYLIAKGYSHFAGIKASSYVHGGLSPEETIIPLMHFKKMAWVLQKPVLLLLKKELRYTVRSSLLLELSNANEHPLTSLMLQVITPGIECDPIFVEQIEGHSVEKLEMKCRVPVSLKGLERIEISLQAECKGTSFKETYSFDIVMKQLMTSTMEFDF